MASNIDTVTASPSTGWAFVFRAFQSRNYRLFFAGQLVSLLGTWLTITATSWLVYRLTNSSRTLGLVNFCGQIPAFLLAPLAGVLVDRWRLHRVLLWTQTLSMLESFGLAAVAFVTLRYGASIPPHVALLAVTALCCLATFQGFVNAFDLPSRQTLVVHLVDRREDLANAIALNSSMFNAARALGPLAASGLIYWVGEAWCFTLDGFTYIAVLGALLMMRLPAKPPSTQKREVIADLRAGWRYAGGFMPIRAIILLLAAVSFSSMPQSLLLPVFATKVLGGNVVTQGLLMMAGALGSLIAAFRLAARKSLLGLGREMALSAIGIGLGMAIFGLSRWMSLSLAGMVVIGFCSMNVMASGNTLLQTIVEDSMRGRVMSLFTMAFMGMMPLGSIVSGLLADTRLGPQWTTVAGGVLCLLAGCVFIAALPAIRREVRPIYVARGILPQAAAALQTTETLLEEGERVS